MVTGNIFHKIAPWYKALFLYFSQLDIEVANLPLPSNRGPPTPPPPPSQYDISPHPLFTVHWDSGRGPFELAAPHKYGSTMGLVGQSDHSLTCDHSLRHRCYKRDDLWNVALYLGFKMKILKAKGNKGFSFGNTFSLYLKLFTI